MIKRHEKDDVYKYGKPLSKNIMFYMRNNTNKKHYEKHDVWMLSISNEKHHVFYAKSFRFFNIMFYMCFFVDVFHMVSDIW